MCGFLGNCSFNDKISITTLRSATKSLEKRGPDANGEFINKEVSFFHQRLSIIDLSDSANQPFKCEETGNVIVYNGEIYNYLEIKKNLIREHKIKFKTNSDTEVILLAYKYLGIKKLLKQLDGMFTFAIWDNIKKQVILARDKLGEKPLFYSNSEKYGLIFGSTFNSVMKSFNNKDNFKISNKSLLQYLSLSYLLFDNTYVDNIKQLLPGSFLIYDISGIKIEFYWLLEDFINLPKEKYTFEEATNNLNYLIDKSVKSRLLSDVKVGGYFSGGVDSSLVAESLKNNLKYETKFHHLYFNEDKYSEKNYAERISKELELKVDYFQVPNPGKIANDFDKIVESMDYPIGDTAYISNYYLAENSSKEFKVVLSGDAGDELFGGYETYFASYLSNKLNFYFPENNRFYKFLKKINFNSSYRKKVGLGYKLSKFFENQNNGLVKSHLLWRSIFSKNELRNFILKHDINYDQIMFDELKKKIAKVNNANLFDKCIFIDLLTWFPNDILHKVDRASMFFSQECRIPLLDPNIIKFSFEIPVNMKISIFKRKKLLKSILNKKISKKLINRKKEGFNSPVGYWIAKNNKFRELVNDMLFSNDILKIFDKKYIENLLFNHLNLSKDNTYKIFNLMVLSQWLKNNKKLL